MEKECKYDGEKLIGYWRNLGFERRGFCDRKCENLYLIQHCKHNWTFIPGVPKKRLFGSSTEDRFVCEKCCNVVAPRRLWNG